MKRAFAITLTVAMIGALAFIGLAGTAAAGAHDKGAAEPVVVEQQPQVSQTASADLVQIQDGDQVNINEPEASIEQGQQAGVGAAEAEATGGDWTLELNVDGENGPSVDVGPLSDTNDNGDNGALSAGDADAHAEATGTAENVTQTQDATIDQSNEQTNIAVQEGAPTATNILG